MLIALSFDVTSGGGGRVSATAVRGQEESSGLMVSWIGRVVHKGWEKYSQEVMTTHGHCNTRRTDKERRRSNLVARTKRMRAGAQLSPTEFARLVVAHLRATNNLADETLALVCPIIEHFGTFLSEGIGVASIEAVRPTHAQAFITARQVGGSPATYASRRIRRMALRIAFRSGRVLGLTTGDPTMDIGLDVPGSVRARPMTDDEVERCRSFALSSLGDGRRSVAWALAEATAQTAEMGLVRVGDVDITAGSVHLSGSASNDPRTAYFTDWGFAQVALRLERPSGLEDSLIIWRRTPKKIRPACSQAVTETIKAAGIFAPDMKPRSVAAWAGRRMRLAGSSIDEVALALGMRSLDQAAAFVGFDWRGGST